MTMYQALYDQGTLAEPVRSKYEELLNKHPDFLEEEQNDEYKVNFTSGSYFQMAIDTQQEVYKHLNLRKWILLKAPEGSLGFITSDRPAFLAYETKNNVPLGLIHEKTILFFPISNKLLVAGSFENQMTRVTIDATEGLIATCNTYTIGYANQQIYASSEDCRFMSYNNKTKTVIVQSLTALYNHNK